MVDLLRAADGIVVEGNETFVGGTLEFLGNSISGSERTGLLVVRHQRKKWEQAGRELELDVRDTTFSNNETPAVDVIPRKGGDKPGNVHIEGRTKDGEDVKVEEKTTSEFNPP